MKYKVGDNVRITHAWGIYSTYAEMFDKLKFTDGRPSSPIILTNKFMKETEFYIFGIHKHLAFPDDTCIAIRDNKGHEYLIGDDCIEFWSNKPIKKITPTTKSKKYWIAVDEKGNLIQNSNGIPLGMKTKKEMSYFGTPVRATLTWNIERVKK